MVTFINKHLIPISTPFLVKESSWGNYVIIKHSLPCRLFLIIRRKISMKKIFKVKSLPKKNSPPHRANIFWTRFQLKKSYNLIMRMRIIVAFYEYYRKKCIFCRSCKMNRYHVCKESSLSLLCSEDGDANQCFLDDDVRQN